MALLLSRKFVVSLCFVNIVLSFCVGLCATSIPCCLSNREAISEILLMYGRVIRFVSEFALFCSFTSVRAVLFVLYFVMKCFG